MKYNLIVVLLQLVEELKNQARNDPTPQDGDSEVNMDIIEVFIHPR